MTDIAKDLVVGSPTSPPCTVMIPGIGQCEVLLGNHETQGPFKRVVHRKGACSWNGGPVIEVDDAALREAAKPHRTNPQWEGRDA